METKKMIYVGTEFEADQRAKRNVVLLESGKVETVDGEVIKREDAVMLLRPSDVDPRIVRSVDGTVYTRTNKGGTLRRDTPKPTPKWLRKKSK